MSGLAILVTTIDSEEQARGLARAAIEAKLAACVQIHPIRSYYVWDGALREDGEWLLQMKHRREDYDALAALTRRLHSYDTPEILRLDVADADPGYLAWALSATARS